MKAGRLVRVLAGTMTMLLGLAVGDWAFATLWTYERYVTGLGSFTSAYALRSLASGLIEATIAVGLVWLAARLFGTKPAQLRTH